VEGAIPFASSPAGAARGNSAVRYLLSGAALAVRAISSPMFYAAAERVCKFANIESPAVPAEVANFRGTPLQREAAGLSCRAGGSRRCPLL
jgi:hypothetical protein